MREIMERRFRWNLRQVLTTVAETGRSLSADTRAAGVQAAEKRTFINERLERMRTFFEVVDTSVGAFAAGQAVTPETFQNVIRLRAPMLRRRR